MRFLLRLRRRQRTREGASPFRVTVNLSGFRSCWLIPLLRSERGGGNEATPKLHLASDAAVACPILDERPTQKYLNLMPYCMVLPFRKLGVKLTGTHCCKVHIFEMPVAIELALHSMSMRKENTSAV